MPATLRTAQLLVLLLHLNIAKAQQLPNTMVRDVHSGKQVPFDKIFKKGEVTLVSFWATWCIPGKRQAKHIVKEMPEWRKKADFNYVAIAVDQQHNEELVKPYVLAQKWNFPVYLDANSELKRVLDFKALPFIMIIDKKGQVVFTHTGFDDEGLIFTILMKVTSN